MTGADFQAKLDGIVVDLQTAGKGQTVQFISRGTNNSSTVFPLSSTAGGVVDAAQLAAIQAFLDGLMPKADGYETERVPVTAALAVFKTERAGHQVLIDAASVSRTALNVALLADAAYQTAKTALDTARTSAAYVSAAANYKDLNISENFGNLGDSKGKYVG